jgi:hypothetical protein
MLNFKSVWCCANLGLTALSIERGWHWRLPGENVSGVGRFDARLAQPKWSGVDYDFRSSDSRSDGDHSDFLRFLVPR